MSAFTGELGAVGKRSAIIWKKVFGPLLAPHEMSARARGTAGVAVDDGRLVPGRLFPPELTRSLMPLSGSGLRKAQADVGICGNLANKKPYFPK
jgi:hypothetical protein